MKRLFLAVFLSCIISCKKNIRETNIDNVFKVLIKVKVKEDDKFQLYYIKNSDNESYTEDKKVISFVRGQNDFQIVEFVLPHRVLPKKFRIDVGESNINTIIEIEEVIINFKNKEIEVNSSAFNRFFKPNLYLERNQNGYMRKTVKDRYDPFFMSTSLLNKRIELDFETKVFHVEAGLRTFNKRTPFPEVVKQSVTGCVSEYHFSPTETSKRNLLNENVLEKTILVTENTVIDALQFSNKKVNSSNYIDDEIELLKQFLKKETYLGHRS